MFIDLIGDGEMGLGLRRLTRKKKCEHSSILDVTTNGLRRLVCEGCGLIVIRPVADLKSDIDRSSFARRSEAGRRRAEPNRSVTRSDESSPDEGHFDDAEWTGRHRSRSGDSLRRI